MVLNKMVKVLNWSNVVATNLCDLKIDCGLVRALNLCFAADPSTKFFHF